ncbi:hypothetical protein IWQ49_000059 [Labrenzia sp. EL_126]|nr:hypothetical protein [Labrenzia sp. EL_126]
MNLSMSFQQFGQWPGTFRRPDATSHRERLEDGSGRSVALRPERLAISFSNKGSVE